MRLRNVKLIIMVLAAAAVGIFGLVKSVKTSVPALKEGTYLPGQTLSVWPSWSVLGNEARRSFPTDPINQLGLSGTCTTGPGKFCTSDADCASLTPTTTCTLHDPETGWSVADRRFSFACSPLSYAYRYINLSTSTYEVRARFENPFGTDSNIGASIGNWDSFVNSFIDTASFKISEQEGICRQDQEISTADKGTCGDGRLNLNKNEQCDPPGRINYGVCEDVFVEGVAIKRMSKDVCDNSCKWMSVPPVACFSTCGNGKIEAGEACDDGVKNGTYNHCNTTCNGFSSLGRCGDGVVTTTYEACEIGVGQVNEKYGLSKNESCAADCQSWGPYCGDRIIQSQYGEVCEKDTECFTDGKKGIKLCPAGCGKNNNLVGWWKFDSFTGNTTPDSSPLGNNADCVASVCPQTDSVGKVNGALFFGEAKRLLMPYHSSFPTSSIGISVWIFPSPNEYPMRSIIYKRIDQKGFRLSYDYNSGLNTVSFVLYSTDVTTTLRTVSNVSSSVWTHIAATYQRQGGENIMRIYVNGKLDLGNELINNSASPLTQGGVSPMHIGKATLLTSTPNISNPFVGKIDEFKLYNRALSADEVKNDYQAGWFCDTGTVVAPVETASDECGNGEIEDSEACDNGYAKNGKPCVPSYNKPCSYCSVDCQNSIDVQPTQYCGNGIIEASEKCEKSGTDIFTAVSNTISTYLSLDPVKKGYQEKKCSDEDLGAYGSGKGAKSCDNCILTRNCVTCGLDPKGVEVSGKIINVLQTKKDSYEDPLMVWSSGSVRTLGLYLNDDKLDNCWEYSSTIFGDLPRTIAINRCEVGSDHFVPRLAEANKFADVSKTPLASLSSYILKTTSEPVTNAKLNSNPLCSSAPEPTYTMVINNDYKHRFKFPIVAGPLPGQYDIIASPIITSTRPKDVRVVVSWETTDEFIGGFLRPSARGSLFEGPEYTPCSGTVCFDFVTTGANYYSFTGPDYKRGGIWYHGLISLNKQAESFTIDTASMDSGAYGFYVRTPGAPIAPFKNLSKLKVDVYLPETDLTNSRIFGAPQKTYYLKTATTFDHPAAGFWYVFNLFKPDAGSVVSTTNIVDKNEIITSLARITIGECTGRPAGAECRAAATAEPGATSCDVAEACAGDSDFCPADQFKSAGIVCRVKSSGVSSCDVEETCAGTSASCPVNSYALAGKVCGFGTCDSAGICNDCLAGWVRCSPGGGCQLSDKGSLCNDGNACTGPDYTDVYTDDCGTVCAGTLKDCRETPVDNPWTTDSCVSGGSCQHAKIPCDDLNPCTTGETEDLASGKCGVGTGKGATIYGCCSEATPCSLDRECHTVTCDTTANVCNYKPISGCIRASDGDLR